MKLKHFWKKTMAVVMAAVTALSVLPATTAYAATGDVATIEFDFVYDSNGNAIKYNSGADIDGYHAGGEGENKFRMYVDGKVGFCIKPLPLIR